MNFKSFAFAAFALTLGGFAYFGSSDEAEAKCRPTNPCANGPTATIDCPGGSVTVSGAAEVVCNKFPGGGQLVGIVGGGAGAKTSYQPPAPKQQHEKKIIRQEYTTKPAIQASVGGNSTLPSNGRCGSGGFDTGTKRILILDCPKNYLGVGANVTYVAGVPGQDSLIARGIILLQNSSAPNGCLWAKSVQRVNGYKFRGKMLDVNYVVIPAKGVLRPEGGISYNTDSGRVAAFEMRPGACGDGRKSVAMSINQLASIRR
ncbi:MAG: hypothetical protein DI585_06195 [Pseudomonas fluorescens]|nr:MAG: hypothetical protein DI585_06195 [Pseudomonas fluorescens]